MKNTIIQTAAAVILIFGAATIQNLRAGALVNVYGVATVDTNEVTLDVFAEVHGPSLRSYGVQVCYDPASLNPDVFGRYDGLWYMADEDGVEVPHPGTSIVAPGQIRLVGARFDAADPSRGVGSGTLLIATLHFQRLDAQAPAFTLKLADPPPFANFVGTAGEKLDGLITFSNVTNQPPPADVDGDGLPDSFENNFFGGLSISDGGETDTDGDGDSDANEWLAGTDPTNPTSRLQLIISHLDEDETLLTWEGTPGRVYSVRFSTDLKSTVPVATGIPGGFLLNELLQPGTESNVRGFYILEADYPTAGR